LEIYKPFVLNSKILESIQKSIFIYLYTAQVILAQFSFIQPSSQRFRVRFQFFLLFSFLFFAMTAQSHPTSLSPPANWPSSTQVPKSSSSRHQATATAQGHLATVPCTARPNYNALPPFVAMVRIHSAPSSTTPSCDENPTSIAA
jgi:hypothetical protein